MSEAAARPNADQAEYWNSAPGRKWLAHEDMLDTILAGIQARLIARADPRPGDTVLDIGCGTGATARALAARVGQGGRVLAVDISGPLLERARESASSIPQLSFLLADAQVYPFEPESVDLVASRFGVMFFDDPVAAFRNLRLALRPGGRICFVAWGEAAANPWFTVPREAAIARLGSPAPQPPTAPGPLAFADPELACRYLSEAGFAEIAVEAETIDLSWPGEFAALASLATSLGPAARILRERGGSPEDEAAIRDAVANGLARFRGPSGVQIPAALNFLAARRN
jgi:SAM-dependent methyltransferase